MEDAQFLAMVQNDYCIDISADWEQDVRPEDDLDDETAAYVRDQMNNGNVWAWCSVCVTVSDGLPFSDSLQENEYLGACSYANQDGFIEGGYFVDMVKQAYERIVKQSAAA